MTDQVVALEVLGSRFSIRSTDPEWVRTLAQLWSPFVASDDGGDAITIAAEDGGWRTELDGREVLSPDPWLVADEIRHHVIDTAVRRSRVDLLDVHAACLTRGDRCLLLIGATGTGKTTLTIALTDAGWRCASDDLSLLDLSSSNVTGVPKPIGVRDVPTWERFRERWDPPSWEVRPAGALLMPPTVLPLAERSPVTPTHAVFVSFERGRATSSERLGTARAVAATGPFVRSVDPTAVSTLTRALQRCEKVAVTYGDAGEAVALLNRWVGGADH